MTKWKVIFFKDSKEVEKMTFDNWDILTFTFVRDYMKLKGYNGYKLEKLKEVL